MNAIVAPIWLGPGTTDCTIIGGAAKTNVLDEGSGNVLTGVTRTRGHGLAPATVQMKPLRQTKRL